MKPEIIAAIAVRKAPDFSGDAKGQMVHDVSKALMDSHRLAQGLYDKAIASLGEKGLVELIGLLGYYCLVSMTLNTFEFDLPEGEKPELT